MAMIPLTVRSHFSLMWGTAPVNSLCRAAARMGYTRLALTDTDNLYGLWPFLAACAREGLEPIIGAEVTDPHTADRAICLVKDGSGYRNLCRLLTCRHAAAAVNPAKTLNAHPCKTPAPQLSAPFTLKETLPRFSEGLVVLTCSPELLSAWHAAGVQVAAAMPRQPLHQAHPLRQAARYLGIAPVATPGSFLLEPADHRLHRILRAIATRTCLSRLAPADVAPADAWLASPQEYARRFANCPEALEQTRVLAEQLRFTRPDFGLVMPPWQSAEGQTAGQALRAAAYAGAHQRYGAELSEGLVDRMEHELRLIALKGFCAYFLIVRDIVKDSSRTCGRGSGAASLVAYCLRITNVCPLKHNLYFERFLNPGRTDPPDIDVDFAWDEREQVIQRVLTYYRNHAAMICNQITFKPRMAVRETARVFGLGEAEIGAVTRGLPWFWPSESFNTDLLSVLKQLPTLQHQDFAPPWPEILEIAQQLMHTPRYLSVHSGGVVITPRPVHDYVPVEYAAGGAPVIQWEKDAAEDAGLVKIDLLGNRSLGVIRDAIGNIRQNGQVFQEEGWEPEDDRVTQETLARGQTMGCFYIESPAMRQLQQKAGAGDFEALVLHSSIIRPAASEFIREYIRRRHGGAWVPMHPRLEEVLRDTFGIMVYQEDVSRVATALAKFSHAEADALRKVMSRKDREHHLQDYYARFARGAAAQNLTAPQIRDIWRMMLSFSGYSFCKPHSASYARVSFQAAYLKAHFPAEFMAAVISNQGGFYSTLAYVSEARRMGLEILAPDVNASDVHWSGHDKSMRVGLLSIRTLSVKTRTRIIRERHQAPFGNMSDFLTRVHPGEPEARALIHCGALDHLPDAPGRPARLWQLAAWQHSRSPKLSTTSLFSNQPAVTAPVPLFPPENQDARRRREFAVLGFLCDRHPVCLYRHFLQDQHLVKASAVPDHVNRKIRFAGWLLTGKTVHTRHGDPMEFLTFEDDCGIVETTFFPQAYKRYCHILEHGHPYILTGTVQEDWGVVTLMVSKAERIALPPPGGGGRRSEVGGQKSEVRGRRSEVGGQRSEVRSQKSEVRGQRSGDVGQCRTFFYNAN